MKPVVYVETSVVSYLVSHPSRDLVTAARQQLTREWWVDARTNYDLMVSPLVFREAERGDPFAAERRRAVLDEMASAAVTVPSIELAERLVAAGAVPARAPEDALHIALAAVHGADLLLTWNFKHIANPMMWRAIWLAIARSGLNPPTICTPEQLVEEGL